METQEFIAKMKAKIENLTGMEIRLYIDEIEKGQIKVELDRPVPDVTMGSNAIDYPGFARMAIEYAVAAIRKQRDLEPLEFHMLLVRN